MRPSWVEIDLGAIAANVRNLARVVAPAELCAVVKADAYGHGDVPVAMVAVENGARMLAVALVEEAVRLREAGVDVPILVLSQPSVEDVDDLVRWEITPTVYGVEFVDSLPESCPSPHVKLDTGMHRVGGSLDEVERVARRLGDRFGGLWTHLAVAEEREDPFTSVQLDRFETGLDRLAGHGLVPAVTHVANTAGALLHPRARRDLVRIGLGMYGLHPSSATRDVVTLHPAMRVVSHVSHVRRHPAGTRPSYGRQRPLPEDATVATIPIGYADGVPRLLSNGGVVLVAGRRRPLAGTVTMDQIVIDVGDEPVEVGDEVVLIGSQGDSSVGADEWAAATGTISYEIVCGIGPRLPRRYGTLV